MFSFLTLRCSRIVENLPSVYNNYQISKFIILKFIEKFVNASFFYYLSNAENGR